MKKYIVLCAVLALCLAGAASGGGPEPRLSLRADYLPVRQNPVEQFGGFYHLTVTNPTFAAHPQFGCAWDVDDNDSFSGIGTLEAGQVVTRTDCQVYDTFVPGSTMEVFDNCTNGCGRPAGFGVNSTSNKLIARECITPVGGTERCWTATPIYHTDYRGAAFYQYSVCVRATYLPDDPLVQTVPDSGGGWGVIANQTFTLINPTSKQTKGVYAKEFQIGWAQTSGFCDYLQDYPHHEYPYMWRTPTDP